MDQETPGKRSLGRLMQNSCSAFTPRSSQQLEASFIVDKDIMTVGEEFVLDARSCIGNILRYEWTFDGKEKDYGSLISHAFQNNGKHSVKLEVFGPYRNLYDSSETMIEIMDAKDYFEYKKEEYDKFLNELEEQEQEEASQLPMTESPTPNNDDGSPTATLVSFKDSETSSGTENTDLFTGRTFLIGGSFKNHKREDLITTIENKGGVMVDDPLKTNVFIAGTRPGKNKAVAEESGAEIWNEEKVTEVLK